MATPFDTNFEDRDVGISQRKSLQARQHTRLAVMSQVWAGAKTLVDDEFRDDFLGLFKVICWFSQWKIYHDWGID